LKDTSPVIVISDSLRTRETDAGTIGTKTGAPRSTGPATDNNSLNRQADDKYQDSTDNITDLLHSCR